MLYIHPVETMKTPLQFALMRIIVIHPAVISLCVVHHQKGSHMRQSTHTDVLEPVWTTILSVQPLLPVSEASCYATAAFRRVGAVEEGNVLISDVPEPG
jgi:hypothetical protein